MALAMAAFVGPWWVVTGSNQIVPNDTWQYRLLGWTFTGSAFYLPKGQTETVTSNYTSLPGVGSVFLAGLVLEASGLVSGLGMVALAATPCTRPALRKLAGLVGVLGFGLVLAAAVVVMLLLPAAANQYLGENDLVISGFWGSLANSSRLGGPLTWGPGWAWYAVLVAAVLFLIGGIVLLRARAAVSATPPPV